MPRASARLFCDSPGLRPDKPGKLKITTGPGSMFHPRGASNCSRKQPMLAPAGLPTDNRPSADTRKCDGRPMTTVDRRPTTNERRATTDNRQPTTDDPRPTTDDRWTTDRRLSDRWPTTGRPTIDDRRPRSGRRLPTGRRNDERRAATDGRRPSTDDQRPTGDGRRATTDDRQPTSHERRPTIDKRRTKRRATTDRR